MKTLVLVAAGIALAAVGIYVITTNEESIGALPLVLGFALGGYGLATREGG